MRCTCSPRCVKWTKICVVLLLVASFITILILSLIPNSPLLAAIFSAITFIETLPPLLSMIVLIEMFGFFIPLGCPVTPLVLAAGFLHGAIYGTIIGVLGSLLGGTVCYVWALRLLKTWVEKQIEKKKIFRAIALAVQDQGFKLGVVCRLSPLLSATILNYTFAVMGVSYPIFFCSTAIGVLPLAIIVAYVGSLADNLAEAFSGDGNVGKDIALFVMLIISSVLIIAVLTWIGKREVKRAMRRLDEMEEMEVEIQSPIQNETEFYDFPSRTYL